MNFILQLNQAMVNVTNIFKENMLKLAVDISSGDRMTQTLKTSHRFALDFNFHLRILQIFKLKKCIAEDFRQQ